MEEEKEDDDDVPRLSSHALQALQEYMLEQRGQEGEGDGEESGMVTEDWRMSQFWYDASTSACLAAEIHHLSASQPQFRVACIACPSLFVELKKSFPGVSAHLFEYDHRFGKYGSDFTFYDYNQPLDLPKQHAQGFDTVVADPPYLSKECFEKTAQTMKHLAKDPQSSQLLVLTGAVQREVVWLSLGAQPCVFRPVHQNKLGNEFMLFTNYDPVNRLGGWESTKGL
ncbi:unnamed protein product [Sphagnum compactum]